LLAFSLCLGMPARAEEGAPDLSLNAEAVALGQRGLQAFRQGDWSEAYDSFHRAETLVHSPVFLLYMARTRAEQGANSEALDLYARVAAEPFTDDTPEAWKQAIRQAEAEAQALRARLAPKQPEEARAPAPPVASGAPRPAKPRSGITPQSRKAAVIASATVGAAGLVLGVSAGIVAAVRFRPINDQCGAYGCNPADKQRYDAVMTWTRLSDLGFVVAGAGLTTAAVFLWIVPGDDPKKRDVGVALRGRF
jgi:tetratricopeptide (TPR) repeat protein